MCSTILIVDDNATNIFILKRILQKMGYNVITSTNGLECIEEFKNNNIDIILLDLMMPIMNGYDTVVEIRKIEKERVPIIVLTGYIDIDKGCDYDDILMKPFNKEQIMKKLDKFIN